MRLVLASNNAKKLDELRLLLGGIGIELLAQGELGIVEAEEPHATFIENALAKARHAAAAAGCAAIADDSGLCVQALGGAPGVDSAYYSGVIPGGNETLNTSMATVSSNREARRRSQDAANNALLLERLQGVVDRRAEFIAALVAVRHAGDPQPLVANGRWPGEILHAPRGASGFGYDALMWIPELGSSVAELDPGIKNRHSHRALAAAHMHSLLREAWLR